MEDRLFIGCFATGLSYADKGRTINGDYARVAFLSFSTLELEWRGTCTAAMRKAIVSHAAKVQAMRGQEYVVSGCGQTVRLGSSADAHAHRVRAAWEAHAKALDTRDEVTIRRAYIAVLEAERDLERDCLRTCEQEATRKLYRETIANYDASIEDECRALKEANDGA